MFHTRKCEVRDWANRLTGKPYSDDKRRDVTKSVEIGDEVPSPFKVVNKEGEQMTTN